MLNCGALLHMLLIIIFHLNYCFVIIVELVKVDMITTLLVHLQTSYVITTNPLCLVRAVS